MATTDDYRRVFERLRQQGELDAILALLAAEIAQVNAELDVLLGKLLITDGRALAKVHSLQGSRGTLRRLVEQFRELARPTSIPKKQPAASAVG